MSQKRKETFKGSTHESKLLEVLDNKEVSLEALRKLAPRGFVNDDMRRKVWPLLMGLSPSVAKKDYPHDRIREHRYTQQVEKDVARSMFHFDVNKNWTKKTREESREALSRMINTLFSVHPDLHYIQGFHDICSVFLMVCGEKLGYHVLERLSLLHIRESLRPSLEYVMEELNLIFPILERADPPVYQFLSQAHVQGFFTLSWVLTWFSHNLVRLSEVARVFDFLLASHPLMPVYLASSLVIHLREGLLHGECDFAAVHQYFQSLPKRIELDSLFDHAQKLFRENSPSDMVQAANAKLPEGSPLLVSHPRELFPLLDARQKGLLPNKNHPLPSSSSSSSRGPPFWRRALFVYIVFPVLTASVVAMAMHTAQAAPATASASSLSSSASIAATVTQTGYWVMNRAWEQIRTVFGGISAGRID